MKRIVLNEKHSLDLVSKLREQYTKTRHRCFFAILNLFLDPATKTTLDNIKEVSPSTASRFFANHTNKQYREFAATLNNWQMCILWLLYTNTNRRGRRGDIAIKFDLTSIEKTGEKLPYVFRFNKILGIHIVLMHVHIGDISFPLDFLVYLGKGTKTQVKLALRMLKKLPPKSWPNRTIVLADAGFGTKGFIRGCLRQGFNRLLVGIRGNRRLTTGEKLSEAERGARVRLHDMREVELTVTSRLLKEKGKYKRYYVVSTFRGTDKWLRRRYRLRWAIESFFQSAKYDFGLKETRLRTDMGVMMWIWYVFVSYSLAMLERAKGGLMNNERYKLTMAKAAREVAELVVGQWLLEALEKEYKRLKGKLDSYKALIDKDLSFESRII